MSYIRISKSICTMQMVYVEIFIYWWICYVYCFLGKKGKIKYVQHFTNNIKTRLQTTYCWKYDWEMENSLTKNHNLYFAENGPSSNSSKWINELLWCWVSVIFVNLFIMGDYIIIEFIITLTRTSPLASSIWHSLSTIFARTGFS